MDKANARGLKNVRSRIWLHMAIIRPLKQITGDTAWLQGISEKKYWDLIDLYFSYPKKATQAFIFGAFRYFSTLKKPKNTAQLKQLQLID